jgi:prepilin-type N-terminal cleavage/methylation domain-containing protein
MEIRNAQRGLSLPELLIALAMLGMLAGVAWLQMSPLLAGARLDRGARQLATDLQLVRMKAIAHNTRFRVIFQTGTSDYLIERESAGGWQRHLLHSHVVGAVVAAGVTLPPGVTIAAANSAGDVVFVPRGHVDGGITITLGAAGAGASRRVIVNLAGRVRIA